MERLTISGGKIGFYNDVINKCSNKDIPSVRKQLNESKRTYEIEEYKYKEYSTDELKAIYNRLAELEDKLESGQLVELPNGWLHILKLLTVASMCYADIKHLMESKIKESKDIADLYFSCPNVQGSTNLWALSSLAESKLDCNKIKGFEDIINAMPNLKEIF